MMTYDEYEFWFAVGSQSLYGEETLKEVERHAKIMAEQLNRQPKMPARIVLKPILKLPGEITQFIKDANYSGSCAGIITWMHTFSPSKMWINGLKQLQKPMLHLHTQFNRNIPVDEIDMDFMNTNQSAHGDREHGFILSRMRMQHKIVVGHFEDGDVTSKIESWMRSAVGAAESEMLKCVRFGDNMREVAVTEGDKVESQIKLGWSVNTFGIGQLVDDMEKISENAVDEAFNFCKKEYELETQNLEAVRYQIKIELAMENFLKENGYTAFVTCFQDLHGMRQLPGMACQSLMKKGWGFGAEGDWKTACLLRVMKRMAAGRMRGTTFMEDYTYHLEKGNELVLGAHMLEICPSIAANRPKIVVEPLGIGGKEAPARLVFEGKAGSALNVSLIDMGGRMRMIAAEVACVSPLAEMKQLPVARVMWKPLPDLKRSAEAWLLAGGAHHSVLSYDLSVEEMRDFAEIMGIEFIHIGGNIDIYDFKRDLMVGDLIWKFL